MGDMTPTVIVGMTMCETTAWISNSQVICQTVRGGGRALTAAMMVSGIPGTGLFAFTYDAPVVTQLSTINSPTSAGVSVTVSGFNFGLGVDPVNVLIGGTACAQSQWVSGSSVTCLAAPGQGLSQAVGMNLDNVVGTLAGTFTFDAPILSHSSGTNGPTTGTNQVTVLVNTSLGRHYLRPTLPQANTTSDQQCRYANTALGQNHLGPKLPWAKTTLGQNYPRAKQKPDEPYFSRAYTCPYTRPHRR